MNSKILFSFLIYLVIMPSLSYSTPYSAIPDRNSRYLSGSKFFQKINKKAGVRREQKVLDDKQEERKENIYLQEAKESNS